MKSELARKTFVTLSCDIPILSRNAASVKRASWAKLLPEVESSCI